MVQTVYWAGAEFVLGDEIWVRCCEMRNEKAEQRLDGGGSASGGWSRGWSPDY